MFSFISAKLIIVVCFFLIYKLFFRNPLKTKNQFSIIKNDVPKIRDHHGRNLLWVSDETESNNNTLKFFPFTMCPAAINQTESARLVLELER